MFFAGVKMFLPLGELRPPPRSHWEVTMQPHVSRNSFGVAALALLLGVSAVAAGARADTELLFYDSSMVDEADPMMQRFAALNPGIKVNRFEAGGETLL